MSRPNIDSLRRAVGMKELAKGLDLTGAQLPSEDLKGLRGDFLVFNQARLEDANFEYVRLTDCDFVASRASRTRWNEGNLHQCSFREAQLLDAVLVGTKLSSCSWCRADVSGACIEGATLEDLNGEAVILRRSRVASTRFLYSYLKDASFAGAEIRETTFVDCNLAGAIFTDAVFTNVRFEKCSSTRRCSTDAYSGRSHSWSAKACRAERCMEMKSMTSKQQDDGPWAFARLAALGGPLIDAPAARAMLQALADSEMPPEVWGTQERAIRLPFDVDAAVASWKGDSPTAYLRRKSRAAFDAMLDTNVGSFGRVAMTSGFDAGLPALYSLCERWAAEGNFHCLVCGSHGPVPEDANGRGNADTPRDRVFELLQTVLWLSPSDYGMQGIVGLAQRTYFGPHFIVQFGEDLLRSIPGAIVRECGAGLLIDLAEEPWTLSEDAVLAKLTVAMEHLAPAQVFAVRTDKRLTPWRKGERFRRY